MQSFEQVARDVGRRWGANLKAEYLASGRAIGNWPCGLDEARRLVDTAVGRVEDSERELLALLVERGARRAWHSRDPVADLEVSEDAPSPAARTLSGVMLRPTLVRGAEEGIDAPRKAG
jgi:hypothetical protein